MSWVLFAAFLGLLGMLWIRKAPSSIEIWHDAPIDPTSPKRWGYLTTAKINGSASQALRAIDEIVLATPRTEVLAGRVEEGKITYITRTAFFGAPDYTTILVDRGPNGVQMTIYGRLRFGYGDSGTNRKRIKGWLQAMQALQQ